MKAVADLEVIGSPSVAAVNRSIPGTKSQKLSGGIEGPVEDRVAGRCAGVAAVAQRITHGKLNFSVQADPVTIKLLTSNRRIM